jgi:hypothetical protein
LKFSRLACVICAASAATVVTTGTFGASFSVKAPLVCSRGPSGTSFGVTVTMPASMPTGSVFTVRIDALPSGTISHVGLNYIYGMTTEYLVPAGTSYVEGSARVVPDTGTANVRPGARVWHDAGGVHMMLPSHVANGTSYTPPSLEFAAKIDAPAGTDVALKFVQYQVMANAIFVGDLRTTCDPTPKPYRLAVLRVDPRE